jgi:hypothetical protein
MSLDFKLRISSSYPPPQNVVKPPNPTTPPVVVQPPVDNTLLHVWTLAARVACVLAILPLLLLPSTDDGAACLHLVTMPITTYVLLKYNHLRYSVGTRCFLSFVCVFLTNIVAISLFIMPPRLSQGWTWNQDLFLNPTIPQTKLPLYILAITVSLAALQLLWVVEKRVMPRVMLCTAVTVLILALALVAVLVPSPIMARRFFQSAALPLLFLFMETSRLRWKRHEADLSIILVPEYAV